MTLGPIQMIAIAFPGSKFTGDIRPRIFDLVDQGIVNIVDAIIIHKDGEGALDALELDEITDDPDIAALYDFVATSISFQMKTSKPSPLAYSQAHLPSYSCSNTCG